MPLIFLQIENESSCGKTNKATIYERSLFEKNQNARDALKEYLTFYIKRQKDELAKVKEQWHYVVLV